MVPSPPRAHRDFRPRPFRPASWLRGGHVQTVAGKWLRPCPDPGLERVRIHTPDGDFLDLDFGPDPRPDAPIVLVLHGLEGSTHRPYVRLAMAEVAGHGMRPVGMNFRSCSGEPNLRPRFYHSGDTGDLAFVIEHLRSHFPRRKIGLLGFSLGGNVLLRYLGEEGIDANARIAAAAAISVPFDLTEGTRCLEQGVMGRVYSHYFLRSLQEKARRKEALLRECLDLDRVLAARTLREFDEAATAPLHGFGSAWEYYRAASSGPILPQVRVPTLLLHAADDPFLPSSAIPHVELRSNPWLMGALHERGGHVGFIEAPASGRFRFWAEAEAARYLATLLDGAEA